MPYIDNTPARIAAGIPFTLPRPILSRYFTLNNMDTVYACIPHPTHSLNVFLQRIADTVIVFIDKQTEMFVYVAVCHQESARCARLHVFDTHVYFNAIDRNRKCARPNHWMGIIICIHGYVCRGVWFGVGQYCSNTHERKILFCFSNSAFDPNDEGILFCKYFGMCQTSDNRSGAVMSLITGGSTSNMIKLSTCGGR